MQLGLYILNHISWWLVSASSITFPHLSLSIFWLVYFCYFCPQTSTSQSFTFFQVLHWDFLWLPWRYIPMHTTLSIILLKIFFTHLTYILFIYMFFVCGVHMCIWMLLCTHSYTWRWVGVLTCATTCESQRLTSSVFLNSFSSIFIIYGESLTWTQRPLAQLA